MLILQLAFAFLLLNTEVGLVVIRGISSLFDRLLAYAADGINFVFGGITIIICYLGLILSKVHGLGNLESYRQPSRQVWYQIAIWGHPRKFTGSSGDWVNALMNTYFAGVGQQ